MELSAAPEKKPKTGSSSKKAKSSVTNGRRLFIDGEIDQRTNVARRFRDLVQLHSADLGGVDFLSEAQMQLVRRVAMIEVQLESLEGRMVAGDDAVNLEEFARVSSHLRRLWEALGVRRVARDVTPTLADIVAAHQREAADAPKPRAAAATAAEDDSRAQTAVAADGDGLALWEAAE